jgi:hypothetical protein
MSSALGAGNGADMLQQILRQKFTEAIAQQNQQQNQQRIALDAQRLQQQQQYQNEQLKSLQEDRAARQASQLTAEGLKLGNSMAPGTDVTGQTAVLPALKAAGLLNSTGQIQTRNLSGIAEAGGGQAPAPRILGLASSVNAGLAPKDIYRGTDQQITQAGRDSAMERFTKAHPEFGGCTRCARPR